MAQTGYTPIITYHSNTAAAVPGASNLAEGELAVNVTDKKIFTKDNGGSVVQIGSSPSTTDTLTNKTLALGSNTVSGTKAQFDTACTDGNFVYQSDIGVSIQAYDSNTAKTNIEQTWTAQQTPKNGSLTDGANIDWNGDTNGQVVTVTLSGNRTMNAPTNINQYALYLLRVTQDATGSRTLAWNAAYKFGGAGAPTLTTTASKTDILSFVGGAGNTLEYLGSRLNAV